MSRDRRPRLVVPLAVALLAGTQGSAAQTAAPVERALRLSAGSFAVGEAGNAAAEIGGELWLRAGPRSVRPIIGAMATSDGALFGYLGVSYELHLGTALVLRPSFAAGYYHRGRGKDLGLPLEFRSGIEASLPISARGRIGLEFYHLSNASLNERNPGQESLVLSYQMKLR